MTNPEMREATFFVLAALANGPKHGYALISEARELSNGRFDLKVGTLYPALHRLLQQGLVTREGDEVVDRKVRHYFNLSGAGAGALLEEIVRLESNAREGRARLVMRGAREEARSLAVEVGLEEAL